MRRKLVLVLALILVALPTAATNINPWNTAYESVPNNSTLISDIDDRMVDMKQTVRYRLDVEHAASQFNTSDANNTGRHLLGSARTFIVDNDTECSTITTIETSDLNGNNALDVGRICYDIYDGELCVWANAQWNCNNTGVPSGSIMLSRAASCPIGYTDISATFTRLGIRIIDTAAVANFPNTAGTICDSTTGGAGECAANTTQYSDTMTTAEMPTHRHQIQLSTNSLSGIVPQEGANTSGGFAFTENEGDGDPHYHPFAAFRLCEKD